MEDWRALLHVGTYEEADGQGLYPVSLAADGSMRCGEPYGGARSASFAAQGRDGRYFMVDEAAGSLGVFTRNGGAWQAELDVVTGGEQPCYVAVDPTGRRLAVANYGSGSFVLWRLDARGIPEGDPKLFRSNGSGPVKDRQEGPHCHCAVFDPSGVWLYVTDLGADTIWRLGLTDEEARPEIAYKAAPGIGPRHLLFAPNGKTAVLVSELGSLLTTFEVADGELQPVESCSTLPAGFEGESLGGHLALSADGSRIYVSNRGHDSIAVFSLDEAGRTELLQHVESGGSEPRHILLLEDWGLLIAAHEKDGAVTSFRIGGSGRLEATGHRVTVPGACFVLRTQ